MSTTAEVEVLKDRVAWTRVALFYGIAFGGAVVVGALLWAVARLAGPASTLVIQAGAAVLYMPLPLVAGLIVERRHGRRMLIAQEWHSLRTRFWRTLGRSAGYAIAVMLAILALGFAVAWLAGWLGVPGAGHLAATDAEFRARMMQVVPGMTADTPLPAPAVVAAGGLLWGLLAGLTVNAVFAFGEEYGWRGVLAQELLPLGTLRANLLTGVLWGLWHAPIIMLGHNYGGEWGWGIPMMVLWTTPLAFLLSWVRERSGSVIAPSILHGAYNGTIGFFAMLLVGGNLFVALPMGLLMTLVLTVLAVVVGRLPQGTTASTAHGAGAVPAH